MPTHYRGTETEVRALNALINLARALDSLGARLGVELQESGLTPPQFGVLETVYHLGPMCQIELGRKLLRSGGNITVVVGNLQKRGLIRRERLTGDRRMVGVYLTADGREMIEQLFPKHVAALVRQFSVLEPEEQETLRRLCKKLGTECAARQERETVNADTGARHKKQRAQATRD